MGNEEEDKELLFLISFLEEAFYTQDVRPSIREAFKLSYLKNQIVSDADAANAAKKWVIMLFNYVHKITGLIVIHKFPVIILQTLHVRLSYYLHRNPWLPSVCSLTAILGSRQWRGATARRSGSCPGRTGTIRRCHTAATRNPTGWTGTIQW